MSADSVSASAAQSPKQSRTAQSPKSFNELEELGFIFSKYIRAKYPLQDGVNFMTIHDDVTNEDLDIKRKGPKIFVSKHKVPRRAPKIPKSSSPSE